MKYIKATYTQVLRGSILYPIGTPCSGYNYSSGTSSANYFVMSWSSTLFVKLSQTYGMQSAWSTTSHV